MLTSLRKRLRRGIGCRKALPSEKKDQNKKCEELIKVLLDRMSKKVKKICPTDCQIGDFNSNLQLLLDQMDQMDQYSSQLAFTKRLIAIGELHLSGYFGYLCLRDIYVYIMNAIDFKNKRQRGQEETNEFLKPFATESTCGKSLNDYLAELDKASEVPGVLSAASQTPLCAINSDGINHCFDRDPDPAKLIRYRLRNPMW